MGRSDRDNYLVFSVNSDEVKVQAIILPKANSVKNRTNKINET